MTMPYNGGGTSANPSKYGGQPGGLSNPVTIPQGGTGQTTQQSALDALAGAQTAAAVLAGDGTHVTLRALTPADMAGLLTTYDKTASPITPNATAGTLGSPVTISNIAGYSGFTALVMNFVTSGLGSETVTLQSVVTYTDNSTGTTAALTTFTTNATTATSSSTILAMLAAADGKIVKSIAFSVKSTINSSAASLTVHCLGINIP